VRENVKAIATIIEVLCRADRPDLAEVVAHTWNAAQIDGLTGVYNRTSFEQNLDHEHARAFRYDRPLSLLILDVDNFKEINDTLGHLAGDDVLRAVANHLQRLCRSSDQVGRIGGDEFAVILPETDIVGITPVLGRLREAFTSLPIVTRGGTAHVSVSVGHAVMLRGASAAALFDGADQDLLAAKMARRSQRLAISEGRIGGRARPGGRRA